MLSDSYEYYLVVVCCECDGEGRGYGCSVGFVSVGDDA